MKSFFVVAGSVLVSFLDRTVHRWNNVIRRAVFRGNPSRASPVRSVTLPKPSRWLTRAACSGGPAIRNRLAPAP